MATDTSLPYEEWLSKDRPLKIVTSGQGGSGKSTLINNFLGFSVWKGAETGKSGKAVTTAVSKYVSEVRGVKVSIFDTPDLYDPRIPTEKTLRDISKVTGGEVDLLYYCLSLRTGQLNIGDVMAFKLLSKLFGKVLWENTVFVLTFANKETHNEHYQKLHKNLTDAIKDSLEMAGVSKREAQCITVIDVGNSNPRLIYYDGTEKDWKEDLFVQSLKMAKPEAIPALLRIKLSDDEWKMLFDERGKELRVGEHWGHIGIVIGSAVGAASAVGVAVTAAGGVLGPLFIAGGSVVGSIIGQKGGKWWVNNRMQEVHSIVALKYQIWKEQRHYM